MTTTTEGAGSSPGRDALHVPVAGAEPVPVPMPAPGGGGCGADHATSEIRRVLDRVGDKWSVLILGTLSGGPLRFTELLHGISGISQRMLTLNLRQLERDGLVSRTVHAVVPPRVDYELTDLGRTLLPPVLALVQWAMGNTEKIQGHRERFDARNEEARG
ncbi:winged helix-turn-helix transcriptional regulator [Oerskovia douganii]|nr:helix-turn-helix domain-containing protein [Oerskovia douganii]